MPNPSFKRDWLKPAPLIPTLGFTRWFMVLAKTLWQEKHEHWLKLASAFYALAYNDSKAWSELPSDLRETDVGMICEEYLKTRNEEYIEKAGQLLAGSHWYTALGRAF